MRVIGIDVSHWEGIINWELAAPGLGFVYYKCTDGIYGVDDKFSLNHIGTRDNFIPSAPFHWYQPNQPGKTQAEHFIEVAGLGYTKYIIDVEQVPNPPLAQTTNWNNLMLLLRRVKELTGTVPAIYTGYYKWLEQIGYRAGAVVYDLLLARYAYAKNPVCPFPWVKPKVWQFTDYGFWNGCQTQVDMDWFYGTKEECISYFGRR